MISGLDRPSARRRATYLRVRSSLLMRVNTMRHSAWFAWRFPPRLRRCRTVLPEDASMGATPHRWANAASLRSRCGLSPAATIRIAAVSIPTPSRARRPGAVARNQLGKLGIDPFGRRVEIEHASTERL